MSISEHRVYFSKKCISCGDTLEFIGCSDNPDEHIAYNLYHCWSCLIMVREDVWDNAGLTWILKDATILKETFQGEKDRLK